ncbi:MAG: cytochrome C oxidase subunit IV family protein [Ignavibacteriaceae bacterium]
MEENKTHLEHSPGYGIYILVWLALVTLTALTATVAGINFGKFSIAVAIIIAMVKSYLVLSEFMHLKFEMMAFRIFVVVAILFFTILIVLLFQDYSFL